MCVTFSIEALVRKSGSTPLIYSWTVSLPISHLEVLFPDRPIILGAAAPENTHTVTRPANGLPTLSRASRSNRITTARLLSNAVSHTHPRMKSANCPLRRVLGWILMTPSSELD